MTIADELYDLDFTLDVRTALARVQQAFDAADAEETDTIPYRLESIGEARRLGRLVRYLEGVLYNFQQEVQQIVEPEG